MKDDHLSFTVNFDRRFNVDGVLVSDSTSLEIDGEMLTDVYLIDDKCSHLSGESSTNCEYFVLSKSKGLVLYKYLNGDTYIFYKKIPCKNK